jgi:hypothetical protein
VSDWKACLWRMWCLFFNNSCMADFHWNLDDFIFGIWCSSTVHVNNRIKEPATRHSG